MDLDITDTLATGGGCGCGGCGCGADDAPATEAVAAPTCDCGSDCTCGCQEGKPCTCGTAATCDCGPDCTCGCQEGKPCTCGTASPAGSKDALDAAPLGAGGGEGTGTYHVSGMTCGHCVKAITDGVSEIPGVTGVDVDLATGVMKVTSTSPVDFDRIVEAVAEAGDYTVE